ncbi:hypothetical protein [Streptomyces sp. NPDC101393]|uniref:hypothetical protein n=1 Tax=Streptomyces sp. NPDC101393 TaxID=3366141 RepID=UPI0038224D7B
MSTLDYLERARHAGLLDEVLGARYVADLYEDPISARPQILVEYCDRELARNAEALGVLVERLGERHPGAASVLLRAPGDVRLATPWRPRFTYLRHLRPAQAPPVAPASAVAVRPAAPGDEAAVHGWLVTAFRNAYPGQDVAAQHPAIRDVLAAPDRRSFIAHVAGEPLGHGTVLTDQRDEVTGEAFAELVDILIDDAAYRRAATSALVAALAHATRGRPLRGHVVHPSEPEAARGADAVVESLLRANWSIDHVFWERTW